MGNQPHLIITKINYYMYIVQVYRVPLVLNS